MTKFRKAKPIIRNYLATAYSDAKLVLLLDYARSGGLRFNSCCCLCGLATLRDGAVPRQRGNYWHSMLIDHDMLDMEVSDAYRALARSDAKRRRILIPMILVEIKRRIYAKKLDRSVFGKSSSAPLPHDGVSILPKDTATSHQIR